MTASLELDYRSRQTGCDVVSWSDEERFRVRGSQWHNVVWWAWLTGMGVWSWRWMGGTCVY